MPMKGRFPIRRTLQYLNQGNVVFKDSVKVMTVNYNTRGELGEGARKFVFFNIPQIQYKNPWVQIMMFKNMTPSPFLRFYLGKLSGKRRRRKSSALTQPTSALGSTACGSASVKWKGRCPAPAWCHYPRR
uniref:Small ribosomal subunit protein mS25 n=1 Tax=Saimiri boliviensis boliviensis TaxID=39432 RepID=A0A2K6V1N3_SAIBB